MAASLGLLLCTHMQKGDVFIKCEGGREGHKTTMHKCVSMAASRVKLTLTNITHQDLYNHYNGQTFHRYSWTHGHVTCVILYTAAVSCHSISNWKLGSNVYIHKAVLSGLCNIIDILSGILSVGCLYYCT